jgi:coproporphyrinogen III oxidase-like Fe-S oxidoreductase
MILQLKTGTLDGNYFQRKFGLDIWNEFEPVYQQLEHDELVERKDETISLTRSGLLTVDHFLPEFFEPELKSVRYV